VTLIEIVDKSKVRLTVTTDDEKGKQVANNTTTDHRRRTRSHHLRARPAQWRGHLLSLSSK